MEGGKKIREVRDWWRERKGGKEERDRRKEGRREGAKERERKREKREKGRGHKRDERGIERPLGHLSSVDRAPSHCSGRMDSAMPCRPNSNFLPTTRHSRGGR